MIIQFTKTCVQCGKTTEIRMEKDRYERWVAGEHIQNVFPDLTPMQRETIISGVCSDECWDKLFQGAV